MRIIFPVLLLFAFNIQSQVVTVNYHLNTPDTILQIPLDDIDYITQINLNPGNPAIVFTTTASLIQTNSAFISGYMTDTGGTITIFKGICYSQEPNPEFSDSLLISYAGPMDCSVQLVNLNPGTTYFARAFVKNSWGLSYGQEISFTTLDLIYTSGNGVTDIDGNEYNTLILGSQEWMGKNLRVKHYNNGQVIINPNNNYFWNYPDTNGYYTWFDEAYSNSTQNIETYGNLYNFYTIINTNNVCPIGWHVPSDNEWKILETFLGIPLNELDLYNERGSNENIGGKLKESGTNHWINNTMNSTNESGFTALGSGYCEFNYQHYALNSYGMFATSTEESPNMHIVRVLNSYYSGVSREVFETRYGVSIRCIKD